MGSGFLVGDEHVGFRIIGSCMSDILVIHGFANGVIYGLVDI